MGVGGVGIVDGGEVRVPYTPLRLWVFPESAPPRPELTSLTALCHHNLWQPVLLWSRFQDTMAQGTGWSQPRAGAWGGLEGWSAGSFLSGCLQCGINGRKRQYCASCVWA